MAGPRGWGKLARRGASHIDDADTGSASAAWRAAGARARGGPVRRGPGEQQGSTPERQLGEPAEVWVRVDDELEEEATGAVARGRRGTARRSEGTDAVVELDGESWQADIARSVGSARVGRFTQRMKDATRAYDAERYGDASRILRQLADQAPGAAPVRELYGLTLYRMQRWRPAIRELEAFQTLASSTEQHPVLADCYRAVRQYDKVEDLWGELRASSPSAELVTEGRIVYAGALIDQGDVRGAVRVLEQGFSFPKRPHVHHLRRAYALADAYERAGDVVRARELFSRVASYDREFADVVSRVRSLR